MQVLGAYSLPQHYPASHGPHISVITHITHLLIESPVGCQLSASRTAHGLLDGDQSLPAAIILAYFLPFLSSGVPNVPPGHGINLQPGTHPTSKPSMVGRVTQVPPPPCLAAPYPRPHTQPRLCDPNCL